MVGIATHCSEATGRWLQWELTLADKKTMIMAGGSTALAKPKPAEREERRRIESHERLRQDVPVRSLEQPSISRDIPEPAFVMPPQVVPPQVVPPRVVSRVAPAPVKKFEAFRDEHATQPKLQKAPLPITEGVAAAIESDSLVEVPSTRAPSLLENGGFNLVAGDEVGRFSIVAPLQKGGQAGVYVAEDTFTKQQVALKVQHSPDPLQSQRLKDEVIALRMVRHENVVQVFDAGTTFDGRVYISMELLRGQALSEFLVDKNVPIHTSLSLTIQVGKGLIAAHAVNIIHRDVKPENIFISERGIVKLLDLGIAKNLSHNSRPTVKALTVGTVAYMSPEHLNGGTTLDGRSDVYSLAVVLYEMVTGHHPLIPVGERLPTQTELARRQMETVPQTLAMLVPEISIGLSELVASALEKKPMQRPNNMTVFVAELSEHLDAIKATGPRAWSATTAQVVDSSSLEKAGVPGQPGTTRAQGSSVLRKIPLPALLAAIAILAAGTSATASWLLFSSIEATAKPTVSTVQIEKARLILTAEEPEPAPSSDLEGQKKGVLSKIRQEEKYDDETSSNLEPRAESEEKEELIAETPLELNPSSTKKTVPRRTKPQNRAASIPSARRKPVSKNRLPNSGLWRD